jgi:hypothetical protein
VSAPRTTTCGHCRKPGHTKRTCDEKRRAAREEYDRRESAVNAFADFLVTVENRDARKSLLMRAWDDAVMKMNREDCVASHEVNNILTGNVEARVRYHQTALVMLDAEQEDRQLEAE